MPSAGNHDSRFLLRQVFSIRRGLIDLATRVARVNSPRESMLRVQKAVARGIVLRVWMAVARGSTLRVRMMGIITAGNGWTISVECMCRVVICMVESSYRARRCKS